jgi:hypothetical protein
LQASLLAVTQHGGQQCQFLKPLLHGLLAAPHLFAVAALVLNYQAGL